MRRRALALMAVGGASLVLAATAGASVPGSDARLSNDSPGTTGYVSNYTLNTGHPYTDDTLTECNKARGRQNEPAVAIDPRNTSVVVGSSNDYCGVYDNTDPPAAVGAIWLGYYRSQDGGRHFQSSLVPGYPDDRSPYRARAQVRTASSGDPVMAWDREGRLFMGSESSGDPAGTKKTLGDVWVASYENPQGPAGPTARDGQEFKRSVTVDKGSSAPNLLGNFNDKTALEVDRTGGPCDGNVYFSWSRFTGNGGVSLDFARSTDHGRTFPKRVDVSTGSHDVQFPDISVTGNGHVYVTYRQFSDSGHQTDALMISKSTDCGASFSPPQRVTSITPYDASDVSAPQAGPASKPDDPASAEDTAASGSTARDCGDFSTACSSGYTFFRRDTQVRSTADQKDKAHEWVYMVYDPSKPGTEVNTGTSYGSVRPGVGSQSGVFFLRYDGASGSATAPKIIDNQATGHQLFPDIAADAGQLHTIWWDSRNDACYSPARPVGNCADRSTVPSLDAFASQSSTSGSTWSTGVRLSDVTSNPNYEQFSNRAVPFAGDYLWIDAVGSTTYGVWTDWRNTVAGSDAREGGDGDHDGADVLQCRTQASDGSFSSDQCPRAGGLDQDIYGDTAP